MKYWSYIFLLLIFNIVAWWQVLQTTQSETALYFLDVGQGDSELIQLGDVQILIDGGPNASVLKNLEKVMTPTDRYIDLVILTHPQLDHFGGLIDVLDRYEVGYFLHNGRTGTAKAYGELKGRLEAQKNLVVVEGDRITHKDFIIKILGPSTTDLKSQELNDTCIVALLEGPNFKALYTGDIGENVEDKLRKKYQIKADVLKVGHHGSRFSSSVKFLKEVSPKIAIIEVGKNSYGHPHPHATNRILQTGSLIYTTLENGLVEIILKNEQLRVLAEK